ncbi:MAG: carboxypeptidase regulatory-like domain-containing protein [Deltaproteobacteria bacterium]|nr:carboxypeptidase regulatory-like domain-containing protein [Deltaproteobacteria bacterium]
MILVLAPWLALAGTLEGTITGDGGAPVANATVVAYDQRLNYAWVNTDSSGGYRFEALPANPYRVRAIPPPTRNLVEEWAGDTLQVCEATVFEVGEGATPVVDFMLEEGGVLRGTLRDTDGSPVVGALVSAHPFDSQQSFLRADVTDEAGAFVVRGLVPDESGIGVFTLEVEAAGWPDQLLPATYDADEAEPYAVAAAQDRDLGTFTLLDGIRVSGTASGPEGPLPEAMVRVYSSRQLVEGSVVDGAWEVVGLPPGEVLAWVRAEGLATTWYPDADRPDERIPALDEGADLEVVDILLPRESRLRGRLLGEGDLSLVSVLAYNDDRTVGVGALAESDGSFSIGGIHGGDYTLFVYAADEGYLDDFVRDPDGAKTVFEVPAEADTESMEIPLPPGGQVWGLVSDLYGGEPVYGATVLLEGQTTATSRTAVTARDGTFAITGLVPDTWQLWSEYRHYCAADPGWGAVYYPDRVNPALAGVVEIGAGDAVEWNPGLPPDHDHDGMDDVWESDHGLDPTRDDGAEDQDGDGFTNAEEYLLGTDPDAVVEEEGECGACSGGSAGLLVLPLVPWWTRRRTRV